MLHGIHISNETGKLHHLYLNSCLNTINYQKFRKQHDVLKKCSNYDADAILQLKYIIFFQGYLQLARGEFQAICCEYPVKKR